MASVFRQQYKNKKGRVKNSAKWYIQFRDANGTHRRLPGFTDKKQSEELGRKLEKLANSRGLHLDAELVEWIDSIPLKLKEKLARWGMLNSRSVAEGRPLTEHVEDFRLSIVNRGKTNRHANETAGRVQAVLTGCRFLFYSDIVASTVVNHLADLRRAGMGTTTSNHYLQATKAFCRWMVKDRRANDNPLDHLSKLDAESDRRRKRRALSQDHFSRLIQATEDGETVCGLTGPDRAMLYLTAAYTGLRASELASLTEASFDFRSDPPTVTVQAGDSKHRQEDMLPVFDELSVKLREWLSERRQDSHRDSETIPLNGSSDPALWPGAWAERRHGGQMLRKDLEAARAKWLKDAKTDQEREERERSDAFQYLDRAGRVFDFHALRGQFITELGRAGVSLQDAQKLARHSDPRLTSNFYTHLTVSDLSHSVGKLPSLPKAEEDEQKNVG